MSLRQVDSAWGGPSCGVNEPGLRAVNKMVTQGFGVGSSQCTLKQAHDKLKSA